MRSASGLMRNAPMRTTAFLFGLACASCCLPFGEDRERSPAASEPPAPPAPRPLGQGGLDATALDLLEHGPVPQAPDPYRLFDGAPPHTSGPIVRGLLVCRATLPSEGN